MVNLRQWNGSSGIYTRKSSSIFLDILDALRNMGLRTMNEIYEFGGNDQNIYQTSIVNLEMISFEDLGK